MSSLGPLFIPRKDQQEPPKIKDNPELERYLRELWQRIHTNELAIQRWANSVPRLAAVMNTAGSQVNVPWTTLTQVPLDGAVATYFPNVIVSNTIVIPSSGWYTISATFSWDPASFPAPQFSGDVEVFLQVNATPLVTSTGTAAANFLTAAVPNTLNIPDFQPFSFTSTFNKGDVLLFSAFHNISPGMPTLRVNALSCAVDFLGTTPTSVQ